jgi:hypothetical protein
MVLSACALAAGVSMTMTGVARASTPDPNWNELFAQFDNINSNPLCVDDPGGSARAYQDLQLYHCHGYDSHGSPQRWQFIYSDRLSQDWGVPVYFVRNTGSNLCLGADSSIRIGVTVAQVPCDQSAYMALHAAEGTNPLFTLSPLGWNLCLSADNFSDTNSTPLRFNLCDPSDYKQVFALS